MSLIRLLNLRVPAALVAISALSNVMHAQERTLFTWSGTVDKEVLIVMRGRDVQTRASGLDASYRPRFDVRQAVPHNSGYADVSLVNGRGLAEVVEQPSARNGYALTIRVRDPRAGQDQYRIVTTWSGARSGGSYGNDDCYDNRRNDDRWDNGRRDRDDRGRSGAHRQDDRRGRNDCDDRGRDRDRDRDNRDRDRDNRDRDNRDGGWNNGGWDNNGGRDAGSLRWSGEVDAVGEIRISGRNVQYFTLGGAALRNVRYDVNGNGLPRRNVNVTLDVSQARGTVQVVQQPSQSNGYTAIVRVTDRQGGYGAYDFNLRW